MNYYIYGLTTKGNFREHNEDCILVNHDVIKEGSSSASVTAPFVTAVCDGVGGEKAGEVASELCLKYLAITDFSSNVNLSKSIMGIHNKIKKKGVNGDDSANMQTTLCALAVDENGNASCLNVGDSRMYRYVNCTIRQISTDQSYSQFLYEHGAAEELDEIEPKYKNAIISSVGSLLNDPVVEQIPLVTKFGTEPDDMIIIVSDGISDYVTEQQLEIGLGLDLPVSQKLEALTQLALDNGSSDNISIIGIKPYIDKEELEAITADEVGSEPVNITEILTQTAELGEILNIDINEIISGNSDVLPEEEAEAVQMNTEVEDMAVNETKQLEKAPEQSEVKKQNDVHTGDSLEETEQIAAEFLARFDEIRNSTSEENAVMLTDNSDVKEEKTDYNFHSIELSHQSASSLAKLEKLLGNK